MSFFVPSVHIGRSRAVDPDDPTASRGPFGAPRRRPKRKRLPIPWTLNIPYICHILLVWFSGFLILLGGAAMSVMGYYPAYFSEEFSLNGTRSAVVENTTKYYHIRIFSFTGPIIMGIGCFAMIIAGVIYFEFRDKYFRDLPQDEIKNMTKKEVYSMLIDQFRQNYFRGIPIPLAEPKFKGEKRKVFTVEKKDNIQDIPVKKLAPCIRKPNSPSACHSTTVAYITQFPEVKRKCSLSTLPSVSSAVILSPLDLIAKEDAGSKDTSVHDMNASTNPSPTEIVASMFRHPSISLSGRTPSRGVENPAYRSDDDSEVNLIDGSLLKEISHYSMARRNTATIASVDGKLTSIIVHAASVHFPPDRETNIFETTKPKSKSLQHNLGNLASVTHSQRISCSNTSCPLFQELNPTTADPGQDNHIAVNQNTRKHSVPYDNCAMINVLSCEQPEVASDLIERNRVDSQISEGSTSKSSCLSTTSDSTCVGEHNCHQNDSPLCDSLTEGHGSRMSFDPDELIDQLDAVT